MATVYDTAARVVADEFRGNSETRKLLLDWWDKLNSGKLDNFHTACFGQAFRDFFSVEEAACCLALYSDVQAGKILICDLPIGAAPFRDAMVSENDAALKRGLLSVARRHGVTFDSSVWCGREDDDGFLSWSPALLFNQFTGAGWLSLEHSAGQLPLEVGQQSMSKTLSQLRLLGGLARWPYGYDTIRLFIHSDSLVGAVFNYDL